MNTWSCITPSRGEERKIPCRATGSGSAGWSWVGFGILSITPSKCWCKKNSNLWVWELPRGLGPGSGSQQGFPGCLCSPVFLIRLHLLYDLRSILTCLSTSGLAHGRHHINICTGMISSLSGFSLPEGSCFGLRWFTPASEVPLCGHATLASAAVLTLLMLRFKQVK